MNVRVLYKLEHEKFDDRLQTILMFWDLDAIFYLFSFIL